MTDSYQQLEQRFKQLARIEHALTFLQWDQHVMMPPGGNEARSESIAELTVLHHEKLISHKTQDLIEKAGEGKLDHIQKCSVQEMQRTFLQASCLPTELVKAQSLAGTKCEHGWRRQRKDNDWPGFLKNFIEVVALTQEEASIRQSVEPDRHKTPYDALLDLYCTGDSSEMITDIFSQIKEELPILLQEVLDKQGEYDQKCFTETFSIRQQKLLNRELMSRLGFDFSKGRIDESSHPFSTGDRGDQRITTRFRENEFSDALQATAHETGHASYERGLPEQWDGLPLGQAVNMCIHESQSLLFEKQLFLSRSFTDFFTPIIHQHFPAIAKVDSGKLWEIMTRVKPSYIRVEADEVTYPMHVILRYEIERELINGNLETKDMPALWDEKMQSYLGLSTAGNYTDGCLQDIHWTDGSFGYFPSYTLGALNSSQIFGAIREEQSDWQERLERGDISFVTEWLEKKIWCKGSILSSQDLLKSATGEGTNPSHFLRHIRDRYIDRLY